MIFEILLSTFLNFVISKMGMRSDVVAHAFIPAIWEAEIEWISVQGQPRQKQTSQVWWFTLVILAMGEA
jgi:hypothetical protein